MSCQEGSSCLHPFDFVTVKRKVSEMIGKAGFTEADRMDLQQELFARLIERLRHHDPDRGHRNVYVVTIVDRESCRMLRAAQAQKRNSCKVTSLQITVVSEDQSERELADAISSTIHETRWNRYSRSSDALMDLFLDLQEFTDGLSEEQQKLVKALKVNTVSEIAEAMKIPRTTLDYRVSKLRKRFEQSDLKKYL